MLLSQCQSWWQIGQLQAVNPPQDLSGEGSWNSDLGELEGDAATVSHHLFAPMFTSFSLKVVSDQCSASSGQQTSPLGHERPIAPCVWQFWSLG